ncbi:MAG TPA: fibronectin type III domain-containing protein, partial [Acidimicrobiales bacterium]|nr:fibronectin type III domain-containing protein [Acidimicrobiales bacterium]
TVTATDAYGNTATGYIGTVHFTSTDPQAALPGDVTFTAGDHGAVTEPVTFKTAGTQTVTATDTTTGSITGTSGTVAVTHAGAAKVVVTAQPPTTVTAGTPFGITAKIKDAYGNTVTTSSATVTVALTANPGSATLLGTTTVTATAGVATFGGLAPDQAGSYVLAVTASGLVGATTSPVVVVAVPAGAPLDVTAVVPSDPGLANGAVVSWGPPTTTGGSPVTSYSVVPTDVTAGSGGPATTVGAAARSATVLGLVAGDLYSFTVTATTSAGPGAPSAASNQVVPVSQLPSAANGATSTSPSGTATASLGTPGTVGSLTATATGTGTVTVARYPTAPIGALTAGGAYYDVSISPGNGFTSVVFTVCGVKIGTSVEWWNPTAQQNQPVSDQTAPQGLAGCVTVTITATTTPNLSQLVGTVFTVPSAEAPPGPGYTLWGADGGVYTFGGATDYGSTRGQIVGVATTPDGRGYWQVGSDGGVFAFGDAPFYGSMGGQVLSAPIVGFAPTPDGNGYWLVAADGGVFAFGDAQFDGSRAGSTNAGPIVGIAPTADGSGYWLVAADGGVFAYGDAPFYGSMGGAPLAAPVVGMTVTTGAGGYWLVAADGGVFAFGDAQFYGSMAGHQLAAPVLSLSPGG